MRLKNKPTSISKNDINKESMQHPHKKMSWSIEQELLIQLFIKHFPDSRLTNIYNHTYRYNNTLAFPEGETRKKANHRRQALRRAQAAHPLHNKLDSFEPYYYFKQNRFIDELIEAHQKTRRPSATMPGRRTTRSSQRVNTTPTRSNNRDDDEEEADDEESVAHSFYNDHAERGSNGNAADNEMRIVTAQFAKAGVSPLRPSRARYGVAVDVIQLKMGAAGNKHDITVVDGDLKKFGDGRGWSKWCHIKLPIRSALDYDKYTLKIHLPNADGCSSLLELSYPSVDSANQNDLDEYIEMYELQEEDENMGDPNYQDELKSRKVELEAAIANSKGFFSTDIFRLPVGSDGELMACHNQFWQGPNHKAIAPQDPTYLKSWRVPVDYVEIDKKTQEKFEGTHYYVGWEIPLVGKDKPNLSSLEEVPDKKPSVAELKSKLAARKTATRAMDTGTTEYI
jgi:hypothetical protein